MVESGRAVRFHDAAHRLRRRGRHPARTGGFAEDRPGHPRVEPGPPGHLADAPPGRAPTGRHAGHPGGRERDGGLRTRATLRGSRPSPDPTAVHRPAVGLDPAGPVRPRGGSGVPPDHRRVGHRRRHAPAPLRALETTQAPCLMPSPRHLKPGRHYRLKAPPAAVASTLVLCLVAWLGWGTTTAKFGDTAGTAGNAMTTGTVSFGPNTPVGALFTVSNSKPGSFSTTC